MNEQWNEEAGEDANNLMAAGAVFAVLSSAHRESLTGVHIVMDEAGNATNQIDIDLSFMLSPYRITVERVKSDE